MDRIVLVTKPTRLDDLILRYLTEGAAEFTLQSKGESIQPYRDEHAAYQAALALIRSQVPNDVPLAAVDRGDVPNFLFRDSDLILVCGPDGLFVNLAKYLGSQPVITINPDPRTIAGKLMLFRPEETGVMIRLVQAGKHRMQSLPLAKASVNDGEKILWAVNDLFIGRRDHASAVYMLSHDGRNERQSSSGIVVSTGTGTTGWIRSILAMTEGLMSQRTSAHKLASLPASTSEELVFVVREPFPSPTTGTGMVTGRIFPNQPLMVTSEMPEGGCLFSDGIIEKVVTWEPGSTVTITVGERHVRQVIR